MMLVKLPPSEEQFTDSYFAMQVGKNCFSQPPIGTLNSQQLATSHKTELHQPFSFFLSSKLLNYLFLGAHL